MNKKLLALVTFPILFYACMLFIVGSFLDILEASRVEFFLFMSSFTLYFVFTISMILVVLHTARKNYEAQKKVEYLENLNEYTKNLEIVYNNLRSFRHDYINIMASLAAYIDEKKYEELETFFYEHILPMQNNLTQKNGTLNNLSNVNILELKSILYTKLLLAVNQDIVFIISNSFIDMGLSVDQMHKKEVTTKGAGHGIGLYNVSEILNRYDNIYHETLIKEGLFIQQVQIS